MNNIRFLVICASNEHFPELIYRKIYEAEYDEQGREAGYIRVYGESGGYLYPANWFKIIELTVDQKQALALAS
ncbi:MAG: hypothetical protein HQM12_10840 [SAR324 cluster bacterium]|nr:hypothetical protein [SAR324 cluster bacterium]